MKLNLYLVILILLFNHKGECHSDTSKRLTISGNIMLGLSWYKPTPPLHKQDLANWLSMGWGLGAVKGTYGIGLKFNYDLVSRISIGSGIYANAHGSELSLSYEKLIDVYYSPNLGYAKVSQVTPSFLSGNSDYTRFRVGTRKYQNKCFMIPVNLRILVTPLKIKQKLAVYASLGFRHYRITTSKVKDYVREMGLIFGQAGTGIDIINADNLPDMATRFNSICPGVDLEVGKVKKVFFKFGVQLERGFGSVLREPSIYLVDVNMTEASINSGGKAVAIQQSARKNSFNFQVGFGYRI